MNDQKSPPFFPEKGRIFHFPPGRWAEGGGRILPKAEYLDTVCYDCLTVCGDRLTTTRSRLDIGQLLDIALHEKGRQTVQAKSVWVQLIFGMLAEVKTRTWHIGWICFHAMGSFRNKL